MLMMTRVFVLVTLFLLTEVMCMWLLPEVPIENAGDAVAIAELCFLEFSFISQDNNLSWTVTPQSQMRPFLLVESTSVEGPLATAGTSLQRARFNVDNCNASKLFSFLTSPAGMTVIDPVHRSLHCLLYVITASFRYPLLPSFRSRPSGRLLRLQIGDRAPPSTCDSRWYRCRGSRPENSSP